MLDDRGLLDDPDVALDRDAIVAEGIATDDEVDAALRGLARFAEDPTTVCGSPRLFQAWSRRTG